MNVLLTLNDPAYGTERSFNGLRLAGSLVQKDDVAVRVFLIGDAVGCAVRDQKVPNGYYHLDRMTGGAVRHGPRSAAVAPASMPAVSPTRCSRISSRAEMLPASFTGSAKKALS